MEDFRSLLLPASSSRWSAGANDGGQEVILSKGVVVKHALPRGNELNTQPPVACLSKQ